MRRKLAAIVAGAMMVGSVSAEDIKMSPVFDVSYLHSSAKSAGLNQGQYMNSRDDLDVQYAGIDFSGTSKSLSWTISANFAGDSANATEFINQAFMSYAINDNASFLAGRFYSFVGFEAARNNGEWNYTKSTAKIMSPYWHEGAAISYDAKNGFAGGLYVVDGVENNQDSATAGVDSSEKGVGATVSYAMDKWKAEFDYLTSGARGAGNDGDVTDMALNFKYDINDKFSFAVALQQGQEDLAANSEWEYASYAGYLRFQASEKLYFAARYEMFSEENDAGVLNYSETLIGNTLAGTVTENDVDSITLTVGHNFMNGSEAKLEYKMDSSDENIYLDGGTADDSNNTVALAWLYNY